MNRGERKVIKTKEKVGRKEGRWNDGRKEGRKKERKEVKKGNWQGGRSKGRVGGGGNED